MCLSVRPEQEGRGGVALSLPIARAGEDMPACLWVRCDGCPASLDNAGAAMVGACPCVEGSGVAGVCKTGEIMCVCICVCRAAGVW